MRTIWFVRMAVPAMLALVAGCSPKPPTVTAAIVDRIYSVTPNAAKSKAGIVAGELSEMKVSERVEEGTGRIESPAMLSGKLSLKNVSGDQTVRLLGGKLLFIDAQGKAIALQDSRAETSFKLSSSFNSTDRLDPGQEAAQPVEVSFPVEALKAKRLKDIRLELSYIPSAYKEETLNFGVSIGGQ